MILMIQSMTDSSRFVVFDAVLEETHTFRTEVTDYSVEDGYAVSDNARPSAPSFSIKGFVSETPVNSGLDGVQNTTESFDTLMDFSGHGVGDAHPLKVYTTAVVYENAYLTEHGNPAKAGGFDFNLQFKVVRTVSTIVSKNKKLQDVSGARGVTKRASDPVKVGKQATTEEKAGTPKASLLTKALGFLGAF